MLREAGLIGALLLLCAAGHAAEVKVEVSSREAFIGVPISVRIEIINANQHEPPQIPEIPDVSVRQMGGPSRNSQITSINGQWNQTVTVGYEFQLVARKEGKFTVPAVEVKADGQAHLTEPVTVVVTRSETGDLLSVELKGARSKLYVGESLDATLQIWIRPYTDRRFQVKLSEADMWNRVMFQNCDFGPFMQTLQDMAQQRQRPRGTETIRKDSQGVERAYYLYEIQRTLWPDRPGVLDVGAINVVVDYPRQLDRDRSIFGVGNLVISQSRPISAHVTVEGTEVKDVPETDRPKIYRGAVGQYQIRASATPSEALVGDPLTLNIVITGNGRLDLLQGPPLPEIEDLNRDFRVPTDPLGGQVQADSKTFTTSIRARSEAVKEIPPIPFAYFDPQQERFVTIHTAPVPLSIKAVDKVSATSIVDASRGTSSTRLLTEVSGGILANYTAMGEVLSQQDFSPGVMTWLLLSAPPVIWLGCFLTQRRTDRLRNDPAFARRRTAAKEAFKRLTQAETLTQPGERAAEASSAMLVYIADRLDLPAGGLTRADAAEELKRAGCGVELVEEVDRLLGDCDALRYGAILGRASDSAPAQARQCIERLEKEHLRAT